MRFVADTNVLSELVRPEPDPRVRRWAEDVTLPLSLSVVTLEEVSYGLSWRPNPEIRVWFESFLADGCMLLPVAFGLDRRQTDFAAASARNVVPLNFNVKP